MLFNEDIQHMFYSSKIAFKLYDWRHMFVNPWGKIWHSCVDTRKIWSSTSITPANNASQKPFSIFIALTWQWPTRITLKKKKKSCMHLKSGKLKMGQSSMGDIFPDEFQQWLYFPICILLTLEFFALFFLFLKQMGLHSSTKVYSFKGERASWHSLKVLGCYFVNLKHKS